MPDAKLLTDDELDAVRDELQFHNWTAEAGEKLLSHIAAQASLLNQRVEIRISGDELPVIVSTLAKLPTYANIAIQRYAEHAVTLSAEIARLRAVPETLSRYYYAGEDGFGSIQESDKGDYVEFAELVAAMRGSNG